VLALPRFRSYNLDVRMDQAIWPRLARAWALCLFPPILACGSGSHRGPGSGWSDAIRQSTLMTAGESGELTAEGLFSSDAPLVFTLETDLSRLTDDREEESQQRPGRITLSGDGTGGGSVPVQVRTRGSFRLRAHICPFPPIRMDFPTDSVAGTVFEGQARLKLVTHCRDWDSYEQNLLEEYLAYRIYKLSGPSRPHHLCGHQRWERPGIQGGVLHRIRGRAVRPARGGDAPGAGGKPGRLPSPAGRPGEPLPVPDRKHGLVSGLFPQREADPSRVGLSTDPL